MSSNVTNVRFKKKISYSNAVADGDEFVTVSFVKKKIFNCIADPGD